MRVALVFTGGTISMRSSGTAGNAPTLAGTALLEMVPELRDLAELEAIDWGLVPGSHLTFDQVLSIGRLMRDQLARDEIDGCVVVQGTDNIEETAFAWDLLPMPAKPRVVVGAMRSASQRGYDGPDNLLNAVAAAATPGLGAAGVVVALDGELHAADAVRKTNTHAYETFKSPGAGRMGVVADGDVHLERTRQPFQLPTLPDRAARTVLLTAVLGGIDPAVERAVRSDPPAGLVVEAMGGGNTQAELLDLARSLIDSGTTVVLCTRVATGRVRPGYGFPGGSSTWWEAGAVFAGTLGGFKGRVALALALGAQMDREGVVGMFRAFGGGARE